MFKAWVPPLVLASVLSVAVCAAADSDHDARKRGIDCPRWTVEDLFASPTPFALGHRGYGANAGEDPTRPLENTLSGFRRAFRDGIRVVELDLQQTADGKIVVIHDDVVNGSTCISSLTYRQLHALRPEAPLFRDVLRSLRHFSLAPELSGIIFAEIKAPIPLCDHANTTAEAEVSESKLVAAVIAEIRRARMEHQVILNSGSPSIVKHAAIQAPEIKRAPTLNVLQLLTPEQVEQIVGVQVVRIPRDDFGLAWYNVGVIARLPAFPSYQHFIGVARAIGSGAVSLDERILLQAGAQAPNLVAGTHGAGLEAIAWTIESAQEWDFLIHAGVDGITTNNIELGLSRQAPLAAVVACNEDDCEGDDCDDDHGRDRDGDHGKGKGRHRDGGKDGDRDDDGEDRDHDRDGAGGTIAAPRNGEPRVLFRAYPNPFTSRTQFAYTVPGGTERVEIGVYDLAGRLQRKLASGYQPAGQHEVSWDGTSASGVRVEPGVFFLRGAVGDKTFGMQLLYVK